MIGTDLLHVGYATDFDFPDATIENKFLFFIKRGIGVTHWDGQLHHAPIPQPRRREPC